MNADVENNAAVNGVQAASVAAACASWMRRGWVTRGHIDLQRVHSSLCSD